MSLYASILQKLKEVVEARALRRWGSLAGNPVLVPRALEIEKGKLCYVIGTVYMDMPLKPNVMIDIARDQSIPPPPLPEKFFSPNDNVMLEDESGRIKLVGDCVKNAMLVTGVIIGALGMETPGGVFEVIDICYAEMAPQTQQDDEETRMDIDDSTDTSLSDEWIGVVSGLEIGSPSPADAQIQMLVEYLTGEGGCLDDQVSASQISRLIIAGDSLQSLGPIPGERETILSAAERKAQRHGYDSASFSPRPIIELSSTLHDLATSIPINILPGESDPSGTLMPQQPFPRALFGDASRYPTMTCETNPTYLTIASCSESGPTNSKSPRPPVKRKVLINSGQPLNDMFKYLSSPPNTRLSVLASTLRWRHMAPTAPDTLWCHPYFNEDPFLITETPDIYIVGGQKRFGTKLVTDQQTGSKGKSPARCRVILIPSFAQTGILVLVNLRTLAVKCVNFSMYGMSAGGKPEIKEEPSDAPSPITAEPQPSAPTSSMDYEFD
ncbi:DNA polymerase delta small subunit [Psilocybe cubensis]|uniref:DNA polymerase delta small subunit n=1 Tax=Psilocybe cubensis TaxID=181762 RepID=A0ACB8H988_PSICU|nr:DNA polymerase delta small subunit [Psilocybe cubensis]KAH9483725.1 DNA polymerase delta small subunit [Psilocybe cubensis]